MGRDEKASLAGQSRSKSAKSVETTPESVKKRIKDSLVKGPLQSGELKASVNVSPTTFYKYLAVMTKDEEILTGGQGRRVYYALPQHKPELFNSITKRTPSELDKHVRRNAAMFLDELLRGDYRTYEVQEKHGMLYQAVLKLHKSVYSMIPLMTDEMRKEGSTEDGIAPWRLYRYWIDVMDYLDGR